MHLRRLLVTAALGCCAAKSLRGTAGANLCISQQELDADYAQEPSKVHWARADARIAKTLSRAGHSDHGDEKKKVDVTSMSVDYVVGEDTFEGFVAYPTSAKGPLPGLLISHAWYGLGEGEMMRAEEAAAKGYAAFALDMYGKGKRATSVPEAMALRGELGSLGAEVQQKRALAGLDQFRDGGVVPELGVDVDTDQLYASGYCAGAIYASELARLDAGVQAVALFHANYQNLSAFTPAMSDVWMQYHHAEFDRVGDDGLLALEKNLAGAGVQVWETLKYGGTSHGFADPTNSIYDERAANQAHASMYSFFKAKMPPKPDVDDDDSCEDSETWHKNGDPAKDCAWVSEWAPRCNVKGADKSLASEHCTCACPTFAPVPYVPPPPPGQD